MQKHARKAVLAIIALLVALPLATANARWLEKKEPSLPFGVYIQGLNGSVVLSVTLDKSGRVTGTNVLRSSGHPALDELARNAAMNWRLSPDSVLPSDISKGRVELVSFKTQDRVKSLLPGDRPYWVQLK
ncbi:MAG TPA: energy transducer TonB [Chthoniobacterales bacterium]|jgi:TonB family protein|nr:energy transducer TonB [Chthoniobacterales bacterium]